MIPELCISSGTPGKLCGLCDVARVFAAPAKQLTVLTMYLIGLPTIESARVTLAMNG